MNFPQFWAKGSSGNFACLRSAFFGLGFYPQVLVCADAVTETMELRHHGAPAAGRFHLPLSWLRGRGLLALRRPAGKATRRVYRSDGLGGGAAGNRPGRR